MHLIQEVGMPADYVNKLARMFQDVKVSEDLNQEFKDTHRNNNEGIAGRSDLFDMLCKSCFYDRVGLAQWVACPPLARYVVSWPLGRVIPKTIIKMVQTASLHRHACVRVGVWQCSPTV